MHRGPPDVGLYAYRMFCSFSLARVILIISGAREPPNIDFDNFHFYSYSLLFFTRVIIISRVLVNLVPSVCLVQKKVTKEKTPSLRNFSLDNRD